MEEIMSDIGSTPSLEPVTDDNLLDLFTSAAASSDTLQQQQQQQQHDQQLDGYKQQHGQQLDGYKQQEHEQQLDEYKQQQQQQHDQQLDGYKQQEHEQQLDDYKQQQQQQQHEQQLDTLTEHTLDSPSNTRRAIKVHSCGFCGSVFPSYPELVEHRATHGGSRPYECHVCNKRFTQKAHLIIHRRTHTGEKPYSCHICHKRFSQTSHLNSHKRVHTGEKPFFCSLCNMGFCRRQRLEAHLQQHAKDMQQGHGVHSPSQQASLPPQGLLHHTSMQQQPDSKVNAEVAKDFLASLGLGGVLEEACEGVVASLGSSEDGSRLSSSKGLSALPQMAVFPGFSLPGGGGNGEHENGADNALATSNGRERDERLSTSPTPSAPSHSQRSSTPTLTTASKSRRKPAFVRKLGSSQAGKATGREQEEDPQTSTPDKAGEEGRADGHRADLSAQEAAVRAMIRMATGADCDDMDDFINDGSSSSNSINGGSGNIPSLPMRQTYLGVGGGGGSGGGAGAGGGGGGGSGNSLTSPVSLNPRHSLKLSADTAVGRSTSSSSPFSIQRAAPSLPSPAMLTPLIRTNSRVSLVDFTAGDLLRHLMSRDDVYRCDFCCLLFQDAAMYHLHRSMHDKMDIRCCSLCGKLLADKYDFTAHFLSQHK